MFDIFANLAIFCFVLFSPLYFLANIPGKTDKHSDEIWLSKTSKIFALYILTPIAAFYAVILYVYLFKIIITWELPKGLVTWLVSSLMCLGLLVGISLYPARYKASRYFGLIMLPLLALMSVGLFRRFADYGITISRGYVLLLNIWSYGICAYVFFTKGQRIKWIFVSFAIVALLFSVGPLSVANITRHILTSEVNKYMNDNYDNLDSKDRKKIRDKVKYLSRMYGKESVSAMDSFISTKRNMDDEREDI